MKKTKMKWLITGVITLAAIILGVIVSSLSCDNYIDAEEVEEFDDVDIYEPNN